MCTPAPTSSPFLCVGRRVQEQGGRCACLHVKRRSIEGLAANGLSCQCLRLLVLGLATASHNACPILQVRHRLTLTKTHTDIPQEAVFLAQQALQCWVGFHRGRCAVQLR